MTTFHGANGRTEPGGNFLVCAGGCGDVKEFPRSFGSSPYWCGQCIEREAEDARAEIDARDGAQQKQEEPKPKPPRVEISRNRRRLVRALVVLAAAAALFTSGWGMWHFFRDQVTDDWKQILPMFVLFDLAGVACAVMARTNRIAYGSMGVAGWLVWAFAVVSGLMSATDAHGHAAQVRFAAPIVAAVMFELLIQGERRDALDGDSDGMLALIKRRIKVRLGLLDALKLGDAEAARAAAAAKLATLAYEVHQHTPGTWSYRRAVKRYQRKLNTTTQRFRFATDEVMIDSVRAHLAALYQSISGTSETAVQHLNLWKSGDVQRGELDAKVREHAARELSSTGDAEPVDRWEAYPASLTAVPHQHTETTTRNQPRANGHRRTTVDTEAIIAEHGEALRALLDAGKLTRYQVEQLCKVDGKPLGGRPAQRVLDAILSEVEAS